MIRVEMIALAVALAFTSALLSLPGARANEEARPASAGQLLVVNQRAHTLDIVDPVAGQVIATVTTSVNGHEVAVSPDGRLAYVPIYGNSGLGRPGTDGQTIEVIDLAGRRVTAKIDLGRPVRPHCAAFGRDGLLYVSAELTNSIDVVDPRSEKRIASISTQRPESHMFVLSKDGRRAYVTNVGEGTISVLDVAARKPIAVVPVAKRIQRISISTDGHMIFTADQTEPRLAVLDTATNRLKTWVPLPTVAYGTQPTRDGQYLLVTSAPFAQESKVAVVDLRTMKVVRAIDVPAAPMEIVVRPDGLVAYVSCIEGGKIAVLDLAAWRIEKLIDMEPGVDGMAWAGSRP